MDLVALIHQCTPPHVSVETMGRIVTVESTRRPYLIGYKVVKNTGEIFYLTTKPKNKDEAIAWATWFHERGYKFDAGPAQVNSVNFARYGLTPVTVFDLCTNIKVGAEILTECYARALKRYKVEQVAIRRALSCYQSGNFNTGFATGYVAKVVNADFPGYANESAKR